jgi:hypothetical protein
MAGIAKTGTERLVNGTQQVCSEVFFSNVGSDRITAKQICAGVESLLPSG